MYAGPRLNQNQTDPVPQLIHMLRWHWAYCLVQLKYVFTISPPCLPLLLSNHVQVDRDAAIVTSSWDTTVQLWDAVSGDTS
jgi:hypothetical protein